MESAKNQNNICARRRNGRKLSKWHADRLRSLEERSDDDYAPFIQYIKWMRGTVPEDNDDFEYLCEMRKEFESLGGNEFFKSYDLELPPIGIGGYEATYLD